MRVFIGLLIGLLTLINGAYAQSSAFTNSGASFTYDGRLYTVSNCNFNGGGVGSSCGSSNATMSVVANTGTDIIQFTGSSGSLLSATGTLAGAGTPSTLSFTMTVTNVSARHKMTTFNPSISGSLGFLGGGSYTATYSAATPAFSPATINLSSGTTSATRTVTATPTWTFSVAYAAQGGAVFQTGTLTSAILRFTPTPEPASVAVLVSGLIGTIAFRRRFFRRSAPSPLS